MTLTQYLIAWTIYCTAAIGCLAVWWRMTRPLNPTLASWLRLWASVAILIPGITNQGEQWLSPALLAALYDGLTNGPEAITRNGILVVGALAVATLIKLIFFRSRKLSPKTDNTRPESKKGNRHTPKHTPA